MPKATRKSRQHSLGAVPSTGAAAARPTVYGHRRWFAFTHKDGALEVVEARTAVAPRARDIHVEVTRQRRRNGRTEYVTQQWSMPLYNRLCAAGGESMSFVPANDVHAGLLRICRRLDG